MTNEFELAKAILNDKLELFCTEMRLLKCPDYRESLLDGTGLIRATNRGRLSFQMVAPVDGIPDLARRAKRPHGEMYEADDHVMLCAVDYRGREWRSNWFLPKLIHPNSDSPNWVVLNELETLGHAFERTNREGSEARLYIPHQNHLPFDKTTSTKKTVGDKVIETGWSLDHHVRRVGQAEVEFRSIKEDWLFGRATQDASVMPTWPGLICQALSFTTASNVRPIVASRESMDRVYLEILSGPFLEFKSHLPPPIIQTWSKTADDFWRMVQLFFEWASTNENKASALFNELAGIRNGAMGSIQTACLTLAVGIESIAALLLDAEPVVTDERSIEQMSQLFQYVSKWDGDKVVRDRATSMLGSMPKVRAVDRLYAFAIRTSVPEALISAWKKLRDMKAHGRTTENDQSLYDLYYSAVELLYRLVCATIGYAGQLTATSQRGWGMDEWGLPI